VVRGLSDLDRVTGSENCSDELKVEAADETTEADELTVDLRLFLLPQAEKLKTKATQTDTAIARIQ
jgi:hypothetical protein